MVNRLDQQRTMEDSKTRAARTKASEDNNQPSLAAQTTLDNQRSKLSSGNREVNRSSDPAKSKVEKPNSNTSNPENEGSLAAIRTQEALRPKGKRE